MGGKLSFAIALLDGKDSGFILNSMHSREWLLQLCKRDCKWTKLYRTVRRRSRIIRKSDVSGNIWT